MSAVISDCGLFRYRLDRVVSIFGGPTVALVGVNPSKADATVNDATIRKDIGFGERLGWARIIKANKFAFRATDVRALRTTSDPIGPENDRYLREIFKAADLIVPCWGAVLGKLPPHLRERWKIVAGLMEQSRKPIRCFGIANDGQPRHTLMLAYDTPLVEWVRPA
jgi:hypothetical protein